MLVLAPDAPLDLPLEYEYEASPGTGVAAPSQARCVARHAPDPFAYPGSAAGARIGALLALALAAGGLFTLWLNRPDRPADPRLPDEIPATGYAN